MKIYVGNLPFSATEVEIRELFGKHGAVRDFNMITDRDTGRPRGFGFLEMDDKDAAAAISALNGVEMDGRAITVNEARARTEGGGGGSRRARW